jgi:hypothetical protein
MPTLDELAPSYVRAKLLDLTLDPEAEAPRTFRPLTVLVSYARTKPDGVCLPLLFEVQPPTPINYQKRTFTRAAPAFVIWTPKEAGRHLVILREAAHDRLWGSIEIQVSSR